MCVPTEVNLPSGTGRRRGSKADKSEERKKEVARRRKR